MKKNLFGLRRGPIAPVFESGTAWKRIGDCEVADSFSDEVSVPIVGMCDLSALPRSGAKGECAAAAPSPNMSAVIENGALCCRLGADEILILSSPSGELADAIPKTMMPSARVVIPRRDSHCQIALFGEKAEDALARLCAVSPPRENELLQTRVADISAIVASENRAAMRAFYILAESGYAAHLWETMREVATKFGGGAVGWNQWQKLFAANASRSASEKTADNVA